MISVALWMSNLELPALSLEAWTAWIEARMKELQTEAYSLLMLPEFACAQWLSFAPQGLPLTEQVPWLASMATNARETLRPLAQKYNVALLPGTMPYALSEKSATAYRNRAWLFLPDGRELFQDKLCLTPSELNPAGWKLSPGSEIQVIEWQGFRVVIAICLDIELTALWAKLGKLDIDLVLVPAKTDLISGYTRVFACARARAIELQTVVCVVGAIGSPLGIAALDTVTGGASIFGPCDVRLYAEGVIASAPPQGPISGQSPILRVADIPLTNVREMRHGAAEAEVWPSSWAATGIIIRD